MVSTSPSATVLRCRLAATMVAVLLTSGCDMLMPKPKKAAMPDFSKAADPIAVEKLVPKSRKTAYSNLFGCTIDLAQKRGLPTPPIDEKYAAAVARQVMADPKADQVCYGRMRAESARIVQAGGPTTSWSTPAKKR